VIPGFQGITAEGDLATLGRGGSDTSAVALAVAVNADRCDIYTDVEGVFTTDPRIVPRARKLSAITYEEMLELASVGAKVLQTRSVGLAHDKNEARVTLTGLPDKPGTVAAIFAPLAKANINVDMIVQSGAGTGTPSDLTFTVPNASLAHAVAELEKAKEAIGFDRIMTDTDVVKVSAVGIGMRSNAGIAAQMFETLAERGINILAISTSEIKVSVLLPEEYTELAVRVLHTAFGLDAAEQAA